MKIKSISITYEYSNLEEKQLLIDKMLSNGFKYSEVAIKGDYDKGLQFTKY